MPFIAGYLLKLSVSLSVVYLFYILVLRRLTFYNCNRWYLLGYSLMAFFIPFINISSILEQSHWDKNTFIQLIPAFSQLDMAHRADLPHATIAWWSFLLAGALIGIFLMMVRFLIRYVSYQRIRQSAQLMVDGGVKVYHVDKSIIPFSFGNAIFINPQLHSEEDLRQIIHHEFIHVKQKHTIDILWGELLCMLNWYNPFAWLIRKAMRQNLEFIADNKVLENGIDKKHYQYLLLKVTGAAHFSITQQFNFSSLKKRIIMMNRSRSARIQLARFLFLLPLLTVLLLAFRSNVMQQQRENKAELLKNILQKLASQKTAAITDTIPSPGKKAAWDDFLKKNPSVKKLAIEKSDKLGPKSPVVVVYRRDGITEKYEWSDLQARALFKKRYGADPGLPEEAPVVVRGVLLSDTLTITADTIIMVDASRNGPGNPYPKTVEPNVLLVVDGVMQEKGMAKLKEIAADRITKINVLKGEQAFGVYGEDAKGKEGVIEVETKDHPQNFLISGSVSGVKDSIVLKGDPVIKIRSSKSLPVSLYIVDGVEFSPAEMEKLDLDPVRIESITVLKDEAAIKIYGERAKNGVIIIELKKPITGTEESWDSERIKSMFKDSQQVIWTINGNTYGLAGGSMVMAQGKVNTIIVNNKVYTSEETNRLFKKNQFVYVAAVDAKTALKLHGINKPAIILGNEPLQLHR